MTAKIITQPSEPAPSWPVDGDSLTTYMQDALLIETEGQLWERELERDGLPIWERPVE